MPEQHPVEEMVPKVLYDKLISQFEDLERKYKLYLNNHVTKQLYDDALKTILNLEEQLRQIKKSTVPKTKYDALLKEVEKLKPCLDCEKHFENTKEMKEKY